MLSPHKTCELAKGRRKTATVSTGNGCASDWCLGPRGRPCHLRHRDARGWRGQHVRSSSASAGVNGHAERPLLRDRGTARPGGHHETRAGRMVGRARRPAPARRGGSCRLEGRRGVAWRCGAHVPTRTRYMHACATCMPVLHACLWACTTAWAALAQARPSTTGSTSRPPASSTPRRRGPCEGRERSRAQVDVLSP